MEKDTRAEATMQDLLDPKLHMINICKYHTTPVLTHAMNMGLIPFCVVIMMSIWKLSCK